MPAEALHIETQEIASPDVQIADPEAAPTGSWDTGEDYSPGTLRRLSSQMAHNAILELEHLKKLLNEQDLAKRQAQKVAAQTHRQLKLAEADANRFRGDVKRAQDQLAFAKQEHAIAIERAAEREASIRKELVEARGQATKALDSASGYRKKRLVVLVGIAVAAMSWFGITDGHLPGRRQAVAHEEPADDSVAAATALPPVPAESGKTAPRDFASASEHLDEALNRFKGEKPEAILKRVHKQNAARGISVCSFAWNNGQVSLLFGAKEGMDVDAAMSRCADAVERAAK